MMGELSAARQVLESADLAPGNNATHRALTRQDRRPALPREPPPRELMERVPERPFLLDDEKLRRTSGVREEVQHQAHPAWRPSTSSHCLSQ